MVLRYFGIRVTKLERSVEFYTSLLDLRVVRQGKMLQGGKWILMQDPRSHQRLELNWYPAKSSFAAPYVPGEGLDHIGFKVKNPAAAFKRLIARGARSALVPTDRTGVRGIYYVKDPDGNWLEFF